jgi:hypothetical protein
MIEAERVLLTHALKDPLNERFAFVSDRYFFQSLSRVLRPSSNQSLDFA